MEANEQIDFILNTFKTVKHIEQQRYRKGLSIRNAIMNRITKGEDVVDNYRIDFLTSSVSRLFKFIEELGMEFNKAHPEDRFVVADIGDILVNALAILENKSGQ